MMEKMARFGFSVNFAPSDKKFVDKFYVLIIQLFRETLSEKSTKLYKPISKGSMGRRIELLHVLNTNEI